MKIITIFNYDPKVLWSEDKRGSYMLVCRHVMGMSHATSSV
jgi:hypothetical protein